MLTWNEERNIGSCLRALARQTFRDFEVIVIDAASTDATAKIVAAEIPTSPLPLRLDVAATRISVGAARNRGVRLAKAPAVAFLSADAEPEEDWLDEAVQTFREADLVFSRQVFDPRHRGMGSAVRGLRYHFPNRETDDPARYASNVGALVRRDVVETFPFGTAPGASAVDDLLLTKRALKSGHRAAYNPRMVVRHHDADSWRTEWRKNRREGLGWGEHVGELGPHTMILAWGVLLVAALGLFAFLSPLPAVGVFAIVLWLPALRRLLRPHPEMPIVDRLLGFVASPPFDLAFLFAYLRGLLSSKTAARAALHRKDVDT